MNLQKFINRDFYKLKFIVNKLLENVANYLFERKS